MPRQLRPKPTLSVQFTDRQLAVLKGIAARYGVSLSAVARWAFDDYIERLNSGAVTPPGRELEREAVAV